MEVGHRKELPRGGGAVPGRNGDMLRRIGTRGEKVAQT